MRPRLQELRFSVSALGDLSYKQFCQMGRAFDKRLEELGAERFHPRTDCDVAYDEAAEDWMEGVLAVVDNAKPQAAAASAGESSWVSIVSSTKPPAADSPTYSRTRPFPAEVLETSTSTAAAPTRKPATSRF